MNNSPPVQANLYTQLLGTRKMLQIQQISFILESGCEAANSDTRTSPSFQGGAIPSYRDGVVTPKKSQFLGLNHSAPACAGATPPPIKLGTGTLAKRACPQLD